MDILNAKLALALGISGALSVGTVSASMPGLELESNNSIIALTSPDLNVTVYEGTAVLVGTASSAKEAQQAEDHFSSVDGIEHVINMITWG